MESIKINELGFFCNHPLLTGILAFRTPGFGSYLTRTTASYLNDGLVATGNEPNAADHDEVSAIDL